MTLPATTDELVPLLYEELRALATKYARGDAVEVSPTSVVHEAFLKLRGVTPNELEHFKALAAKAMRQVLIDRVRKKAAVKHGAGLERVTLSLALEEGKHEACDVEALDAALTQLESLDARQARIVELRYFAGLSVVEVARELQVSTSTVEKEWRRARAWLGAQLKVG
ncbi:MAG: sigma-70 family RNA polymerase sigma factor [Archangium sp.]|nr:sigma-70 family RNA polymerase sigma factor [Archangium sp.]